MAQPSVASYFNNRKRAAADDIKLNSKVLLLDTHQDLTAKLTSKTTKCLEEDSICLSKMVTRKRAQAKLVCSQEKIAKLDVKVSERSHAKIRRIGSASAAKKVPPPVADGAQPQIVKFFKLGELSPKKKTKESSPTKAFGSKESYNNIDKGHRTPVKLAEVAGPSKRSVKLPKDFSIEEIKAKLSRSKKIALMATSINKINEGMDKLDKMKAARMSLTESKSVSAKNLKAFDTIEVEVPISPTKQFTSPIKLLPVTPIKLHDIMTTPKKTTLTPRKLLMSPPSKSPSKVPAYMRFQHLVDRTSSLPMPYKHRNLTEIFKSVDTVCAMFFNRKEKITFKNLKPAVQRMMRKNFHESHLAQIHQLYPDAFNFTMEKTRNYGSATKHDHYQLVIVPNVKPKTSSKASAIDESDVLKKAELSPMNPLVMMERQQRFQNILLELVKDEHETFLQKLDPPVVVARDQIRRWHPEFDLENCVDVKQAELPQAPQEEKFSSAQDVLLTARRLFNCNTPMERALERLEVKKQQMAEDKKSETITQPPTAAAGPVKNPVDDLLKGVPKSLLEKIRLKQAAKALDAMTRRPSQDKEAARYSSLPDLARHLRSVFVTERKGVLPQEAVIRKIENSYRGKLSVKELEEHLQLLAKAVPDWLIFHDLRQTIFIKLNREKELGQVIETLEKVAAEKAK